MLGIVASLSVSGVSIFAASGNSFFSDCLTANSCRVKAAIVASEMPGAPRCDARADGLASSSGRSAPPGASRRGFGRLISRMVLCDRLRRVDGEERVGLPPSRFEGLITPS